MPDKAKQVGLFGLIAIVVGSMVGGGVFNLPSNMADGAALGPVLIAWVITGFGMYFLANTFKLLSDKKPELSSGIYSYASEGFGKYVGFNSAWGYWLSAALGNVSFAIMLMEALAYFFPVFMGGNNWQSILGGSIVIWGMNLLVMRGVSTAALLNTIATIAKLIPLLLFMIILLYAFHWDKLSFDIWGQQNASLGGITDQLRSTMLITLWSFVGIEGAVVISGRAKNKKDIGKATLIGFIGAILIYASISIFSFGIMNQVDLANLPDPSVAYVMQAIVGDWGAIFINIGIIISILGVWIAWTIITAEVPYRAAEEGVMPSVFKRINKKQSPVISLIASSILMQLALFTVIVEKNAFLTIISMAGTMILIPYALSALYLWKLSSGKNGSGTDKKGRLYALLSGIIASFYAIWLVYAAGLKFILMSTVLYALGIFVYYWAHKEKNTTENLFKPNEKIIAICLVISAVTALLLMTQAYITIEECIKWAVNFIRITV